MTHVVFQVLQFNTNCPECNAPAQTNMKLVRIFCQAVGLLFISLGHEDYTQAGESSLQGNRDAEEGVAFDETVYLGFWVQRIRLWFLGSCVWPESYLQIFVNKDCHGLHNLALF